MEPKTIYPDNLVVETRGFDVAKLTEELFAKLKTEGHIEPGVVIIACVALLPKEQPASGEEFEVGLTVYLDNGTQLECKCLTTIWSMH